ncbi:MAG: hypothetical protein J6D03_07070 [Clostridia bacterium]|nr:hypothetical protein [Clostridia bacterium]
MSIEELFEQNSDEILNNTTEEYKEIMKVYGELREELETELNLTDEQKDKLEKAFCLAFDAEHELHKQCFVKGFKMAKDLLMS